MRALKISVLVVVALVVLVAIVGSLLPSEYRVERSALVEAPPELVFEQVNSFRSWDAWSPWIARDPSIENEFHGPAAGEGAKVTWTSDESGSGSQTIVVSEPPRRIETELDFGAVGTARADWTFEPTDTGTRVTWGMTGDAAGPLGGYFAPMMDDWIGPDYEDGLARLADHAETLASR
ncbi:MAG: SRPBCC family protein [Myxococcota bacterium]